MTGSEEKWLRDPLPAVREQLSGGADIVASRADKWPREQSTKWGAVLCMGFVYFKSSIPVRAIMSNVVEAMGLSQRPDDQVRAPHCCKRAPQWKVQLVNQIHERSQL